MEKRLHVYQVYHVCQVYLPQSARSWDLEDPVDLEDLVDALFMF